MLTHRTRIAALLTVACVLLFHGALYGATYYVDNSYSTNGDGTASTEAGSPNGVGAWNSLITAADGPLSAGDILEIREGTGEYRLSDETSNPWEPDYSGTTGSQVIIQNYANHDVWITGQLDISGSTWTHRGNGVYEATAGTTGTTNKFPFTAWYDRGSGEERLNLLQTNRDSTTLAAGYMRYNSSNHVVAHLSDDSSPANASYFNIPYIYGGIQFSNTEADYVTMRSNPSGGSLTLERYKASIISSQNTSNGLIYDNLNIGWCMDRGINQTGSGFAVNNYKFQNNHVYYCGQEGIRWVNDTSPNSYCVNNEVEYIQTTPVFEYCVWDNLPGFTDNGTGIRAAALVNGVIRGNDLHDMCGGKNAKGYAIDLENGTPNMLVEDNLIYNLNVGGGGSVAGHGIAITNTEASESFDGVVLQNNRIWNVDIGLFFDFGATLPSGDDIDIINNTIAEPSNTCVFLDSGTSTGANVVMKNNIFSAGSVDVDLLIRLGSGAQGWATPEYNVYWAPNDSDTSDLVTFKGTNYTYTTVISSLDTNGVYGDPEISLAGSPPSMKLLAASGAAYNAGTSSGAPSDDFEGDSRPQAGTDDIGADEFLSDANEPNATITATDSSAAEASADTGTFRVTRDGSTSGSLAVSYSVSGTASSDDYDETLSGTATITDGNSYVDITITPNDDSTPENSETLILTVSSGSGYKVGSPSSATVNIADNDDDIVTITATDASASEEGPDTGQFTVSRGVVTEGAITVNYSVSGTADANDYNETLSGSVAIGNGNSSATITITPNDDILEESAETLILTVTSGTGYTVGSPNSATVTISDNDGTVVTITATDSAAAEAGADTGTFNVSRGAQTSGNLTVNYVVTGTSNSDDYDETLSGSVVISDTTSSTNITITPNDDAIGEWDETVILTITTGTGYDIGSPSSATVTITDDDGGGGSGPFQQDSGPNYLVSMEAENFHVNRSGYDRDWNEVTSPAGASGSAAMQAVPDEGSSQMDPNFLDPNSPELEFTVDFVTTGEHYIWARTHNNNSGGSESFHYGLDDAYRYRIYGTIGTEWTWDDQTFGTVSSTGEHTVSIWMREDGIVIDKIVLTTNSGYTPSGTGPAESSQGGGGPALYNLTVTNGSPDGNYPETTTVYLVADAPGDPNETFDAWTGDVTNVADVNEPNTTISMPGSSATVTATYSSGTTYTLTVNSGTGDGNYAESTVVAISADEPNSGWSFDEWTGDTGYVDYPNNADANVAMPASAVTVTATFSEDVVTYTLTVNSGTGDGDYAESTVVGISADAASPNQAFDAWTGDTGYVDYVNNADANVTMPASAVTVTATYENLYVLTVTDGTGDGEYAEDDVVAISAVDPGTSGTFDAWTGDTAYVDDVDDADTNVVMPASAVTVNATFTYTLAVTSGTGDGEYSPSTVVQISADAPGAGERFDEWTGDTGYVQDVDAADSNVTMPTADVSVTATYYNVYVLTVNDGTGDGNYAENDVVAISAREPNEDWSFDEWTGDTGYVEDVDAADSNVTMPGAAVTVTATFSPAGTGSFQQDSGPNYLVSMEAENFHINSSGYDRDWNEVTSPAGASGGKAMQTLPNEGAGIMDPNFLDANSPELEFTIDFVTTGEHYIWARTHNNNSGGDESFHYGLDDSYRYRIYGTIGTEWTWDKQTFGTVGSTGEHTVQLWMREDGCVIDKIVLTTNSGYTPSGTGPAESSRN